MSSVVLKQIYPNSANNLQSDDEMTAAQIKTHPSSNSGIVSDVISQAQRGQIFKTISFFYQAAVSAGKPLDDRDGLFEKAQGFLQSLPPKSIFAKKLTQSLTEIFYQTLPHPPVSYFGSSAFRTADGSGMNFEFPNRGAAGTPYSRLVSPMRPKPANLPDPGLVFDLLLKRKEFIPHPSGLSSTLVAFVTIIVHEIFSTSHKDPSINETSSYIDLATLYGNNQAEQDSVRDKAGYGRIHNDSFASDKLSAMPPAVGALLIIFSRNHNHIVSKLLGFNEHNNYSQDLLSLTQEQRDAQDEELFQFGRNVNVAWFFKVAHDDYVPAYLNRHRANSAYNLDLASEIIQENGQRTSRGIGNVVSAEFNLLYRWHSMLSESDSIWAKTLMTSIAGGGDASKLTPAEFMMAAKEFQSRDKINPATRVMQGLKRGANGSFDDADLAEIIKNSTDSPAAAFNSGVPEDLRVLEIIGMMTARNHWKVCTMNEFRKYFDLAEFKTFEEWNSDPMIANNASLLYGGKIDDLELYPGIMAEESKKPAPGSGICIPYTMARAVLHDAATLIRSDRFLTHDFNTTTLTSWGMKSLENSAATGGLGQTLPKLLFTHLPAAFRYNSTYSLMSFYTPTAAKEIHTANGVAGLYDFERTTSTINGLTLIDSFADCTAVLLHPNVFAPISGKGAGKLHDSVIKAFKSTSASDIHSFYQQRIELALKNKSIALGGDSRKSFDVVRDIFNTVPLEWIASQTGLPIRSKNNQNGLFTIFGLRSMLCDIFTARKNVKASEAWRLWKSSTQGTEVLENIIKTRISTVKSGILNYFAKSTIYELSKYGEQFYAALGADISIDSVIEAMAILGNVSHQAAIMIDFYLRVENNVELTSIQRLISMNDSESDSLLHGYIKESLRIALPVLLPHKVVQANIITDTSGGTLQFKGGDVIMLNITKARMDEKVCSNPTLIDPGRPSSSYALLESQADDISVETHLLAIMKVVLGLKNIKKAIGRAGTLNSVISGEDIIYFDHNNLESSLTPVSMHIEFEYCKPVKREDEKSTLSTATSLASSDTETDQSEDLSEKLDYSGELALL